MTSVKEVVEHAEYAQVENSWFEAYWVGSSWLKRTRLFDAFNCGLNWLNWSLDCALEGEPPYHIIRFQFVWWGNKKFKKKRLKRNITTRPIIMRVHGIDLSVWICSKSWSIGSGMAIEALEYRSSSIDERRATSCLEWTAVCVRCGKESTTTTCCPIRVLGT